MRERTGAVVDGDEKIMFVAMHVHRRSGIANFNPPRGTLCAN